MKFKILIGLAVLTSGCGNLLTNPYTIRSSASTSGTGTISGSSLAACAGSSTIVPATSLDWGTNYSGTFSACIGAQTASTTATEIQLFSQYTSGTSWCFIPAIASQYGRTYINAPGTANPMVFCGVVNGSSAKVNVPLKPGSQFNSAYVFDSRDQSQMASCLSARNPSACPRYYSFGVL
ncbi:MAG: hypothetical protein KA715_08065 [Xanthomonadaceae bacterium]|nr:hypothetical protein [Xanthomonadaceae bacterium]